MRYNKFPNCEEPFFAAFRNLRFDSANKVKQAFLLANFRANKQNHSRHSLG